VQYAESSIYRKPKLIHVFVTDSGDKIVGDISKIEAVKKILELLDLMKLQKKN